MDTIYVVYKDYAKKGKGKPERAFMIRKHAEQYIKDMSSPGNNDDYIIDPVEIELGVESEESLLLNIVESMCAPPGYDGLQHIR